MQNISVALCTFNGARFLAAQLASLQAQAGVGEIVAVDDGSTDDTMEILDARARSDRRLKIHRNPARLGVARNFQRAIRLATGEWIALADQDDLWLPDKIERMRARWDGRAVLLHHASHKFRGVPPAPAPAQTAGERGKFSGRDVRRLFYRNSIVGHTMLVRADVVRGLMPFPAGVPHDWWIGAGGAAAGAVQYGDEYLVHYRIHGGNSYHPAGSRLRRLRAEHDHRLRLLDALASRGGLRGSAQRFAEDYRDLLVQARRASFPGELLRFYWRHAGVLFGRRAKFPGLTRLRKCFCATLGAMGPWRPAARTEEPFVAGWETEGAALAPRDA